MWREEACEVERWRLPSRPGRPCRTHRPASIRLASASFAESIATLAAGDSALGRSAIRLRGLLTTLRAQGEESDFLAHMRTFLSGISDPSEAGSCWRRAMSALALLRCACAASSLHHPATRRPPFPCCRFSRLSVANSVGGAAVPRVCEGGSAGLRRQAGTLPGYGDEGTCCPTLRGAQLTPTAPTADRGPRAMEQTCLARGFPQGSPHRHSLA